MDLVMFEGSVDLENARHERPAWVERLEQEGILQSVLVTGDSGALRLVYYIIGFAMIIGCLYLLVNGLANVRGLFG
jgi:hypothetical protein